MDLVKLNGIYPPIISLGEKREVDKIYLDNKLIWPPNFGHGKLYNVAALTNLANTGWRVPTITDMSDLSDYLWDAYTKTAALHLYDRWELTVPRTRGNLVGFSAIPAGYISLSGGLYAMQTQALFWTSIEASSTLQKIARLTENVFSFGGTDDFIDKKWGCSVRLIKNDSTYVPTYTDNSGNTYKTAKIGNQVWIIENLKDTKLNTGVSIPIRANASSWAAGVNSMQCASYGYNAAYD